ncbi:DUF4168 domain-containing protein [Algiphilus sp. W345]|uniref:DUF4168 domain-containing protein n=1 Tax=Banduia mediterranea TaxID=3075609 RepID=A0ABU2WMQ4_9GAMM|nr:DUF4168 domain-containing protein [Algiphilus sp. W345]MDT0499121.1 DUF4168 domain-containing protein [Algiphilus sp. W345]
MRKHLTVGIVLASLATAPLAFAQLQEPASPQSPMTQTPQVTPVSEAEIDQFVASAQDVRRINAEVQPKLKAAGDAQAQTEIKQDAAENMKAAIEDNGLSVSRYQEIYLAMQTNPEVAQKVQSQLKTQ